MKLFVGLMILYIASLIVPFYIRGVGWTWVNGWLYILPVVSIKLATPLLVDKELMNERTNAMTDSTSKSWDRYLVTLFGVVWLFIPSIFAYEAHHKTPQTPPNMSFLVTASLIACLSNLFAVWAICVNKWYSSLVRIQIDRKHKVCSDGPYQYMRHPSYTALIIYCLIHPFVLLDTYTPYEYFTSYGTILSLFEALLFIVRTKWEDETLINELVGYKQYAQTVKYRLFPYVW